MKEHNPDEKNEQNCSPYTDSCIQELLKTVAIKLETIIPIIRMTKTTVTPQLVCTEHQETNASLRKNYRP